MYSLKESLFYTRKECLFKSLKASTQKLYLFVCRDMQKQISFNSFDAMMVFLFPVIRKIPVDAMMTHNYINGHMLASVLLYKT